MDREERLDRVITEYLQAMESGQPAEEADWVARHPDLADDLRSFFASQRSIDRMAAPLRQAPAEHTTPHLPGPTAPLTIRYLGDYELLAEIARGGMGVVFRARQMSLNRTVAVKMILAGHLASAGDVARFRVEAESAAALDHPNILPIYEVGEHEGQPYFSMKLVDGGSLAGRIETLLGKPREAARLMVLIARAVAHAHQRGTLHRDLKPANVLLDTEGRPYVSDFGLARRLGGDSGLTQSGAIVGTPSYMAPEQARAEKALTVAADIWAIGAMLYECLTGRPPFRGATQLDTVLQVLERDPEIPSRVRPGVPHDLEIIALKCLNKKPEQRYPSVTGLADDLDRYLSDRPIHARPVGNLERTWRWMRRNPVIAALMLALVLTMGTGTVVSLMFAMHAQQKARDAEKASLDKDEALIHSDGLRLVALSESVRPGDPALGLLLALEGAERGRPRGAVHNNALVNAVLACREQRLLDGVQVLAQGGPMGEETHLVFRDAAISPDGRRVVAIQEPSGLVGDQKENWHRNARSVSLWDVESARLLRVLQVPGLDARNAQFSPDGKLLAVRYSGAVPVRYADGRECLYTDRVVRVFDVESGKEKVVLRGHTNRLTHMEYSPDGRRILTASGDGTARVWDAETGKPLAVTPKGPEPSALEWARFAPDGKRILTYPVGASVETDIRSDQPLPEVDPPLRDAPLAPSADRWPGLHVFQHRAGGSFGTGEPDRPCRLYDAETGTLLATLALPAKLQDQTTCAAFHPDGKRIVTGYYLGKLDNNAHTREVRWWDSTTGKLLDTWDFTLNWHFHGHVRDLAFNPSGTRLLMLSQVTMPSGTGRQNDVDFLEMIDLKTRWTLGKVAIPVEERRTARESYTRSMRFARFSPDGERVLYLLGNDDLAKRKSWMRELQWERATLRPPMDPVAYLWHPTRGEERLIGHTNDIANAQFAADGQSIVTAGIDGTVRIWSVELAEGVATTSRGHGTGIAIARYSPDGRSFLTARGNVPNNEVWGEKERGRNDTTSVRIWDSATGRERFHLRGLSQFDALWRERLLFRGIQRADFRPDGRHVLTLGKDCAGIMQLGKGKEQPIPYTPLRLWDLTTGKEVVAPTGLTETFRDATFSPDGKYFLAVSAGPTPKDIISKSGMSTKVDFSTDPRLKEPPLLLFSVESGKLLRRLGPRQVTGEAIWASDSRRIFTFDVLAGGGTIWNVETGQSVGTLKGGGASAGTLDSTGKRLLGYVSVDRPELQEFLQVWDTENGEKLLSLKGHTRNVFQAVFSRDGRRILSVSRDETGRLWDGADGTELLALRGHVGPVRCCAISPDGAWLATGGDDGTTRIWDAQTGAEWLTIPALGGPVLSVEFSPDGQRFLTATRDGVARTWPVDPLASARARRSRELSEGQRKQFGIEAVR